MKKILIADVKSPVTNLLLQFLSSRYHTDTKDDVFDALIWLQQGNFPDLIICDFNLPESGGIELVKRVKESGYFRNIPILIISGNYNSLDRMECLKLGAADYLAKPYSTEDLLINIEKFIL